MFVQKMSKAPSFQISFPPFSSTLLDVSFYDKRHV